MSELPNSGLHNRNRAKVRLARIHALRELRARLNQAGEAIDTLEEERRRIERTVIEQASHALQEEVATWSSKLKELESSLHEHYLLFDALMAQREHIQVRYDQELAILREH